MDGPALCTGCERLEKEMKILTAKFESNEQTFVARVQNMEQTFIAMEQTFLKAVQDLHTGLKHSITYRCHHESSSSNSEDIGRDPRKRKLPRLKRRPKSGYRCKKAAEFPNRRKGKKEIMKTNTDATGIVIDGAECEFLGTDKWWLLAEAIREHSVSLVSQLPFDECELSDMLIPDCLTEDETQSIRKLPNRRSKIRSLLCLLAGRDYGVLKKFLAHAKRFDEALVETVWKTFEEKVNIGSFYPPICILCSIKNNVEVSYVIDHLYSRNVVTKKLLQKTACSKSQANESLWDELYEICLNHHDKRAAFTFLAEALEAKGHYKHLSAKLKKSEAIDQLCMCPKLPSVHLEAPVGNSSAPDSSDSPYTSLSIQSTSSFGEDTSNEETMDPTVSTTIHEKLTQETIINGQNCVSNGESGVTSDKASTRRNDSKQENCIVQSLDETRNAVIELSNTTLYNLKDNVNEGCHNAQRTLAAENPQSECLLQDVAGHGSISCVKKTSLERYFESSADASKGNRQEAVNGSPYTTDLKKRCISVKEPASRPNVQTTGPSKPKGLEIDGTNAKRTELSGSSQVLHSLRPPSETSINERSKRVIMRDVNSLIRLRRYGQHNAHKGEIYRINELLGSKSAPESLKNFHFIRCGNVSKSCKSTDSENASSETNSQTSTWKTNIHATVLKDAHLGEVTKCQDDKTSRLRKTTKQGTRHQLTDEATQTLSDLSSQNQTFVNNNFALCLQVFIVFILATLLFIIYLS
ncbi:hypothetical protein ACJMK2_023321 [Sinanodonta woodiana]|uniref:CARD domain-containing protein n=1 Tax=Sinanodonta woodiana TaxID=1069815 RepID=A0ABD3T560_SINWO